MPSSLALVERLMRRYAGEEPFVVILPGGRVVELNGARRATAPIVLTVRDWRTVAALVRDAPLTLGEAWTDGRIALERGTLSDFVAMIGRRLAGRPRAHPLTAGATRLWRDATRHANARAAARRNVAHHYDLSLDLYRRFLDEDLQYSCAYFARPDATLEEAQAAKKALIAAKLRLEPGLKVLDIGCGWGGLGLTLAGEHGVEVEGITLSKEQLAVARERAVASGLAERARFSLTDYRDVAGPFDRVVSVGMFEHVGRLNYQAYFDGVARLTTDDGVAVIHSIGRGDAPRPPQPWIDRYVFPGGYIPALSEVLPYVERAGLIVTDVEIWRLHYAETLRHWRERFEARRGEIVKLYDERFCRMWEFYMVVSEAAFRFNNHMVFQLQLAKRVDAVPQTRAYLADTLKALETAPGRAPLRSVDAA